jgi:DedD protein
MDLRVKQRLVGASILLVAVVLIVPELLSGPKPPAATVLPDPASAPPVTRTVTVPVEALSDGPVAEPAPPSTPPEAAPAPESSATARDSAPMPLENAPSAPKSMASAEPSPTAKASPGPPLLAIAGGTPEASAGHGWAVQLGSFASKPNAEKLARELGGKGYAPYVSPLGTGATLRYRVRLGPFAERAAAERMLAKLQSQGVAATLAPPSRP